MRLKSLTLQLMIMIAPWAMADEKAQVPDWVAKCKQLEDIIEVVATSKSYNETALVQIFQVHKKLDTCDDGSYAEGISDITVKALVQDYEAVIKVASEDKGILAFILKHTDSTTDRNDLDSVIQNSIHQCPKSKKKICKQIERVAKEACKETHKTGK